MDVWVYTSPENAARVVLALKEFGFSKSDELFEILQKEKRVVGMGIPPMKIEVVTSIDGVTFKDCLSNCLTVKIDDIQVPYISLKDLRKTKKASGQFKDLNDLEHLPED
jgi:hypothetical protein